MLGGTNEGYDNLNSQSYLPGTFNAGEMFTAVPIAASRLATILPATKAEQDQRGCTPSFGTNVMLESVKLSTGISELETKFKL